MSEMNNVHDEKLAEEMETCTPVKEDEATPPQVVNHVMYPESVIKSVLDVMNGMSVTGADNIVKFADVYRTLASAGQIVPVTMG